MAAHRIVHTIERADPAVIRALGEAGVATVHEAAGRIGLLGPAILPRQEGLTIAGSAITVSCHPGDNLMIHAAVEVTKPGDVLVVANTARSTHGMFGDLLATSLQTRGVLGIVSDAGVRDIRTLREMRFGVWSRAVHAQGTVKASPGDVNVPVVLDGGIVHPGDVIIADDDGVMVVPLELAADIAAASADRVRSEQQKRPMFESGALGMDLYGLRDLVTRLGIEVVP